jgi:hypothetical protein
MEENEESALMARLSLEARSAAAFRAGDKRRPPPKHLSAPAKRLWIEIVADRPIDWFRPGSFELLEQYCEITIQQRQAIKALQASNELEYLGRLRVVRDLASVLTSLAGKLRISVQNDVHRRAVGKAAERGDGELDPLLAGEAAWGEHVQ